MPEKKKIEQLTFRLSADVKTMSGRFLASAMPRFFNTHRDILKPILSLIILSQI